MIVRVLVVEDDLDAIDEIQRIFQDVDRSAHLTFAKSYESAVKSLTEETFDFITLDLKIPAKDDELDTDPANGMRILSDIVRSRLGTPVIVLTGSPAEDHIDAFAEASRSVDVWGSGQEFSTVRVIKKNRIAQILPILADMIGAVKALGDLELRGPPINVTQDDDRLIRIMVRRRGGVSYSVVKIGGGLSGADVYSLSIVDAVGANVGRVIMKAGSLEMADVEERNFGLYANRLHGAATPRSLGALKFGAGSRACAAYTLAHGFDRNGFEIAEDGKANSRLILKRLLGYLEPWRDGVPEKKSTVRDVRVANLSDEKAAPLLEEFGLDWVPEFEARPVQVRWCSTHGDFHGGNILVNSDDQPTFIDYGDIGDRAASFDWVTLELSLMFHKDGPARGGSWPTLEQCKNWADLAEYLIDCPFSEFVATCRENASACAIAPREVAAAAYSYLLRQLRYSDTDKERLIALLEGVRAAFQ